MRLRLVERERALRALEGPAPELLVSLVVSVPGMPSRSDRTRRASYRVRVEALEDFTLPEAGAQRVNRELDGALRVEVDASRGSPATDSEIEDPAYLASSDLIDFKDPEVVRFGERALRGVSADRLERAATLRQAVARHMSRKNFATAFASASDAVRSRQGDCTEHAVLLAAVLRADGIPARVATGLVHASIPGSSQAGFAWHMWVQALVDGSWLDLDPTRALDFDGGHLLVSTSALERGGAQEELSEILPLLGRLEIELLEIDGRTPKQGRR
jgi:transglutaminase-like putative cysteine protease